MKIRNEERFVETSGLESTNAFQISASSHMFRILSDGLYSDKVTAVIRELTCNARDAHTAAGKEHIPYKVHLPTVIEPYFQVFDQGIGLSFDDIMSLYTTYGESLKNNTNDMIGGLGLGSKAGFAYADQYQVEGRWHGKSHLFSCYVDEIGEPQIAHISTLDTPNRPNGLQINIPVKQHDVTEFVRKATALFEYYEPRPECNIDLEFHTREVVLSSDDWKLYKGSYSNSVYAIQGQVRYPIDRDSLTNLTDDLLDVIKGADLDIWFDIGELEVAANREALSYSDFTINSISNKLSKIKQDMIKSANKSIIDCSSLWEASIKANKMYDGFYYNNRMSSLIIEGLTFGNKPVHDKSVSMNKSVLSEFFHGRIKYIPYESSKNINLSFKTMDQYHSWRIENFERFAFYYLDTAKSKFKVPSTIKMHLNDHYLGANKYVVLVESSQSEFKALLDYLGNPSYHDVSTLAVPAPVKRDTTAPRMVKLKKFKVSMYDMFCHDIDHDINDGGVYVKILRGWPSQMADEDCRNKARLLKELGDTTPIYGVPGTYHSRLDKNIKVWKSLDEHYEKVYKKHLSKLGDRKQVDKYLMLSTVYKDMDLRVKNFLTMFKNNNTIKFKYNILNSIIKDYKLYNQLDNKYNNKSIIKSLVVKDTKYTDTVSKELREVWEKHPIISQGLVRERYQIISPEQLEAMRPDVELILEQWSN